MECSRGELRSPGPVMYEKVPQCTASPLFHISQPAFLLFATSLTAFNVTLEDCLRQNIMPGSLTEPNKH